ncbi:ribonuclease H-like domain-containing protein [Mycena sanguinolenta]|nr:ribonuclease H-like domain-containing protein [Mycena sanguinolenta]
MSTMWSYFYKGKVKQNTSHWNTYCKGCVKHEQKLLQDAGTKGHRFLPATCERAGSVRGDKSPWITHILGGKDISPCPHASDAAKKLATSLRDAAYAAKQAKQKAGPAASAGKTQASTAGVGTSTMDATSGRKHARSISEADPEAEKRRKQGVFQVFSGLDQPFSTAEAAEIQAQALRATVSAGLPFRVWENVEVQKLFGLLRSGAPEILPSRKLIGGRLLNEAAQTVEERMEHTLRGEEIGLFSDGWKARSKADVHALCANVDYKYSNRGIQVHTLKLLDMTAQSKDGPALCKLFGEMIDEIEEKYNCYVIVFGTDADGGSNKGRVLLGKERPWLFVPSCWAHQFQLILGDYFKVFPYAAEIAEKATGLIAWINNHGKVRKIFDGVQEQLSQDRLNRVVVLAYIVANLTRWTTHCIAFIRLLVLREYLQFAVLQSRGAIIAAQVGAAKSTEAERLKEEATHYCELISDTGFWSGLNTVVEDIEPICYETNINQKDSTRADQVLLTLAGLYLHYVDHPEPEVSTSLVARLEKRWKACDQPLFLVALILNPFEGLSCFGPRAKFDHFKATSIVTALYRRIMGYPGNKDSPEQRSAKERSVSHSMLEYLSSTGGFQNWEDARNDFEVDFGKDPIMVWTALKWSTRELALFAILILKVVIKAAINADNIAQGVKPAHREKRKNHKSVEKLLAVPRYRDLLEEHDDDDESRRGSGLVSSAIGWRVEMAKWIAEVRAADEEDEATESDDETTPASSSSTARFPDPKVRKWTKMTLAELFGGAPKPVRKFTQADIDVEAELMEALANAEEDERPDDGAIECSDDEYVP